MCRFDIHIVKFAEEFHQQEGTGLLIREVTITEVYKDGVLGQR